MSIVPHFDPNEDKVLQVFLGMYACYHPQTKGGCLSVPLDHTRLGPYPLWLYLPPPVTTPPPATDT